MQAKPAGERADRRREQRANLHAIIFIKGGARSIGVLFAVENHRVRTWTRGVVPERQIRGVDGLPFVCGRSARWKRQDQRDAEKN